jgi:hypothetical protein
MASDYEDAAAVFEAQISGPSREVRAIGIWALFALGLDPKPTKAKPDTTADPQSEVDQLEREFALRCWQDHRAARFGLRALRVQTSQAMACDLQG